MPISAIGDADQRHRQLHLEDPRVDVGEPFRLVGMPLQVKPGDERLVAPHDHHDEEVRDHHHVDQLEHRQHDLLLPEIGPAHIMEEVDQLLDELVDVDSLRHDQAQVQGGLQPPAEEDEAADHRHLPRGRDALIAPA